MIAFELPSRVFRWPAVAVAIVFVVAASSAFGQTPKDKKNPAPTAGPLQVKMAEGKFAAGKSTPDLLCVALVPGTAKAYAGGSDGKIALIDFDDPKGKPEAWDAHTGYVSGLALAGKFLVSGGSDHRLIWWDPAMKTKIRELVSHDKKWIRSVAASPDGKRVASVGDDMVARVWDAESGKLVHELIGHEKITPYGLISKLYCVRFSADGKFLATGDQTGTAIIWDAVTGKQAGKIRASNLYTADTNGHTYGGCRAVAFSPDSSRLALAGNIAGDTSTIGGSKGLVQIFDWKAGKMTHDLPTKINGFFESIQFHPKDPWLFAGCGAGDGKKVVLFDLDKKAVIQEFPTGRPILDIALNESADMLVAVGRAKAIRWHLSR